MINRISSIKNTRKKIASFVLVGLVLGLVMATGFVFAANGESYRDFDFDDLDPAVYVPAQPAHPAELHVPAELSDELEWQVLYDSVGNMLLVHVDEGGNKWLHPDSVGTEWFKHHTKLHYYVDDFGNIRLYSRPIVINGVKWHIFGSGDDNPFLAQLPIVINGMKPAYGRDANGNEIYGWIREVDLYAGRYPWLSPEEQFQVQLNQAQEFFETGVFWLSINLYGDEYATEIIGEHRVIVYPAGQPGGQGIITLP